MPAVLTTASQVSCSHGGKVTPLVGSARLTIVKAAVLTVDTSLSPILSCSVLASSGPPVTAPCLAATMKAGSATKLKVGGKAVLLATLSGITDGQPAGENAGALEDTIRYAVSSTQNLGPGAIAFQFAQVGNDQKGK